MKEKIIERAEGLFMHLGIRSVTMDDVARELAISKKTLYQYFENKDALVTAVAEMHIVREKEQFVDIAQNADNAIHELHGIMHCMRQNLSRMNPSTLHDLEKFHKNAWDAFLRFKHEFIRGNVEDNLKRGMREGYYRKEIDAEILSICRMEQVQLLFDNQVFPPEKFDFSHVQLQVFDHFVHGLLTDEGRILYKEFQRLDTNSTIHA